MAIVNDFDINEATTPKPWGAKEEQVIRDLIKTLTEDTISGVKNVTGHKHGKLYNSSAVAKIDTSTTSSINIIMGDNLSSGLVIKDTSGNSRINIDSSLSTPVITLNSDVDITGKLYADLYNLYGDLAIQTRQSSYDINFNPTTPGGYNFNLDTSSYDFKIFEGIVDYFLIHDPGTGAETYINTNTTIDGDLDVTGTINFGNLTVTDLTVTNNASINDLDVTTNIDAATISSSGIATLYDVNITTDLDVAGIASIDDLDVTTNIDTATLATTGNATIQDLDVTTNIDAATGEISTAWDVVGELYGNLYDLYGNKVIDTRNIDSTIYFSPDVGGGFDFNLKSTSESFRVHDGSTEIFHIDIPVLDLAATFEIPVIINDDLNITGTFTSGGILNISNSTNALQTGHSWPIMYGTVDTGAAYPFLEAGHLVIQARQTAGRDIVFVTGTTPNIRMTIDDTGLIQAENQIRINEEGLLLNRSTGYGYVGWSDGAGTTNWTARREVSGNVLNFYSNNINGAFTIRKDVAGTPFFTVNTDNGVTSLGTNYMNNTGVATKGIKFDSSNHLEVYSTAATYGDAKYCFVIWDDAALAQGNGGGMLFGGNDGGGYETYAGIKGYKANATSGNTAGQMHFQVRANGQTPATKMVMIENGWLGLNTFTPAYNLDVNGTGRFSGNVTIDGTSGEGLKLNRSTGSGYVQFQDGSGVENWMIYHSNTDNYLSMYSANGVDGKFQIGSYSNSNILFVDCVNGRVGIDTSNPTVPFDVTGASRFSGAMDINSTVDIAGTLDVHDAIDMNNTNINNGNNIFTNGTIHASVVNNDIGFHLRASSDSNNNRMLCGISSGGNSYFQLYDSSEVLQVALNAGGDCYILQNTGIGVTPSGTYKFQVNGNAYISSSLVTNSTVTINDEGLVLNRSGGSGYVSWTNGSGTSQWAGRHGNTNNELRFYSQSMDGLFRISRTYNSTPFFQIDTASGESSFNGDVDIVSGSLTLDSGEYIATTGKSNLIQLYNDAVYFADRIAIPDGEYIGTWGDDNLIQLSTNSVTINGSLNTNALTTSSTVLMQETIDAGTNILTLRNNDQGACESTVGNSVKGQAYYLAGGTTYTLYDTAEIQFLRESGSPSTADGRIVFRINNGFGVVTGMQLHYDGGLTLLGSSQGASTINAANYYVNGTGPLTDYVFERHYDKNYSVPTNNIPASTFEKRYQVCKSIDTFVNYVKENKCLPAFYKDGDIETESLMGRIQKLLETVETFVYHLDSINQRLKLLESF